MSQTVVLTSPRSESSFYATQPVDEHLDHCRAAVIGGVPAVVEQFRLGHHSALMTHQVLEYRHLEGRQLERRSAEGDGVAGRIHGEAGGGMRLGEGSR
jgi:hypothetical protein